MGDRPTTEQPRHLRGLDAHSADPPLMVGDAVEVLSADEIALTLDERSMLDGLPFMREMTEYCGGRYRVLRPLKKFIVEGRLGLREIANTVILEGLDCSGAHHGECQLGCMIIWKQRWLKKVSVDTPKSGVSRSLAGRVRSFDGVGSSVYSCQATSLFEASVPLAIWDLRQHVWDVQAGTFKPHILARTWFVVLYNRLRSRLGLRKLYLFHGGTSPTPSAALNLRAGELVEVKSRQEVAATLDCRGRNRGLSFAQEMVPFCGRRFRVLRRLDHMIVETTGAMQRLSDTVLLEGAHCDGEAHFNCQRGCRMLFKEIWLKRV